MKNKNTKQQHIQSAEAFEIVDAIASQSIEKLENLLRITRNRLYMKRRS